MANRLEKVTATVYSPGRPYQPPRDAYCYQQLVSWRPGYWSYQGSYQLVYNSRTGQYEYFWSASPVWVPPQAVYEQVCVPAQPEVPAIPPSSHYDPVEGWNAGGRSVKPLIGDGYFGFKVAGGSAGVVVGLSRRNQSQLPNEPTHGFFVTDELVHVIESGEIKATAPTPHVGSTQLRIIRAGTQVHYTYDGWTYASAIPLSGPQYLDAALYLSGDAVYEPLQGQTVDLAASASVGVHGALGRAYGGVGRLLGLRSRVGAHGRAYVNEDGDEVDLLRLRERVGIAGSANLFRDQSLAAVSHVGVLGRTRFAFTGADDDVLPPYNEGFIDAQLPALSGFAVDHAIGSGYGEAEGMMPALTGEAYGGMPQVNFSYAYGVLPPLSGSATGFTGGIGEADGDLPALTGLAIDQELMDQFNYGQASGVLPMLVGSAVSEPVEGAPNLISDGLMLADFFYTDAMARARFSSALELSFVLSAQITIEDFFFDGLALGDQLSFSQTVEAFFESTLHIGTGAGSDRPQVHDYAVNLDSSALSTYDGFAFDQYLRLGGQSYGVRADGLYRITDQPEEQPISVFIDFGASDYGTAQVKTVTEAYLGLFTDGDAYLRVNLDGKEYVYRLRDRGPSARAVLGRGAQGRRWNVALEICDATQFELDSMELLVGVHQRRFYR